MSMTGQRRSTVREAAYREVGRRYASLVVFFDLAGKALPVIGVLVVAGAAVLGIRYGLHHLHLGSSPTTVPVPAPADAPAAKPENGFQWVAVGLALFASLLIVAVIAGIELFLNPGMLRNARRKAVAALTVIGGGFLVFIWKVST